MLSPGSSVSKPPHGETTRIQSHVDIRFRRKHLKSVCFPHGVLLLTMWLTSLPLILAHPTYSTPSSPTIMACNQEGWKGLVKVRHA